VHVLSYGGNFRHNTFDISLAPNGDARNEGGVYGQDEILLGSHFRWVIGGRVDKFSSIEKAVFSPRTTLMLKPNAANTFRVSFNRAFRAPSFINNNISTTILNEVNLSALSPALARFVFPIGAVGNPNLKQETMTAYELGYTGVLGKRANVTAAVYWNRTEDGIYFTPVAVYTPASPPPGWPLPPAVLGVLAALNPPVQLPSRFTYLNLGTVKDKGIELGVDASVNRYVNVFTNYSYQWMPEIEDFAAVRHQRHQLAAEEPLQRRLRFQLPAFPWQHVGQSHRLGVLAGRPRCAVRGLDKAVHHGQRRRRRSLAGRSSSQASR
jgi:outer membrane receptor protein involved in Fe transport